MGTDRAAAGVGVGHLDDSLLEQGKVHDCQL